MLLDQVTCDSATFCYLLNTRKKNNLSLEIQSSLARKVKLLVTIPELFFHLNFSSQFSQTILDT